MNVLFFSDSPLWGGHEKTTALFANAMASQHEVTFLHHHPAFPDFLHPDVRCIPTSVVSRTPLPFLRNLHLAHIRSLTRLFRQMAPDVVIVSQGCIERGIQGILAARRAGRFTVSYIPLAYTFRETGASLALLRDRVDRFYYRIPDAFVTVTRHQRDLLLRFTRPGVPVHILPDPVEAAPDTPVGGAPFFSPLRLLCPGNVYFLHKNQGHLLDVAEELQKTGFPVVFTLAGQGPDLERFRSAVTRRGLVRYFETPGWLSDLGGYIRDRTDALILPSLYEGCPQVLLEALALGKPFLVSNLGFAREFGLSWEYLFNPRDPAETAERIRRFPEAYHAEVFHRIRAEVLERHSPVRHQAAVREFLRDCRDRVSP